MVQRTICYTNSIIGKRLEDLIWALRNDQGFYRKSKKMKTITKKKKKGMSIEGELRSKDSGQGEVE